MPIEGKICPYCMKPIVDSSLKYYVRFRDREAWERPGSPLAARFKQEASACRRDNHYKQFWTERLAEEKIGRGLEDRLVVTGQKLQTLMSGSKGTPAAPLRQRAAVPGGLLSDGRSSGLLQDGRRPAGKPSFLIDPSAQEPEKEENPAAAPAPETAQEVKGEKEEIRVVREGGQYKIYLGGILAADTRLVCENCWNVLPPQLIQDNARVIHISLVAGVGAGKSCLLLSWLRSVNKNLTRAAGKVRVGLNSMPERYLFESIMWDDLDYPKVYEEMIDRFEKEDICPKKTDPTFVPPIFLEAERMDQKGQKVLLCIYDAAGEVLTRVKARNWTAALMQHLRQSDAIIFLVDPADAGLKTKGNRREYADLEQRLCSGATDLFYQGQILDPGAQAHVQSDPIASRTLGEIMRALLAEQETQTAGDLRQRNNEAAFQTLDNYLRHEAMAQNAESGGRSDAMDLFRDKLMALVLPKSDSFREFYEEEYPAVFQTYEGKKGMDRDNFESAHADAVRDFFSGFYNLEEFGARYPRHREFILSALGCEARPDTIREEGTLRRTDHTKLEGEYDPFRIEDPIHWILGEMMPGNGR